MIRNIGAVYHLDLLRKIQNFTCKNHLCFFNNTYEFNCFSAIDHQSETFAKSLLNMPQRPRCLVRVMMMMMMMRL